MSMWSSLGIIVLIPFVALTIPHSISSHRELLGLWRYLRERHFRTWVALGGSDAWSELQTTRGVGSMRKIYATLESIDDPELQEFVNRLKQHERFAERVLVPMFLIATLAFAAGALT